MFFGVVWNETLICSRNVIWESVLNFCCLNLSNPSSFLDLSYYALKSILITTSHACSDVPFPKVFHFGEKKIWLCFYGVAEPLQLEFSGKPVTDGMSS